MPLGIDDARQWVDRATSGGLQAFVGAEAVSCEVQFTEDILSGGIPGLSLADMRQYLEYTADQRLVMPGSEAF